MPEKTYSPRNILDTINISTPKFEGFKYLNNKYNKTQENTQNESSFFCKKDIWPLKERIIFSEKKKEKPTFDNIKINNSNDSQKYFSTIFYNYQKMKKKNEKSSSQKQISFDEKSENFLFNNDKTNNDKNKISDNKNNLLNNGDNNSNNKNENDESFNYDLPLEMDKSSEFFNFNQPQGKLMQCLNDINENTNFQEFNYNNIFNNNFNKEKK